MQTFPDAVHVESGTTQFWREKKDKEEVDRKRKDVNGKERKQRRGENRKKKVKKKEN